MAEEVPVKVPKKKSSTPQRRTGLQLSKLIIAAMKLGQSRRGMSVVAIKKCLKKDGVDVVKYNGRINAAIVRLKNKGELVQVKGTGASGSFKLPKKEQTPKKPKVKRVVKKTPLKKKPSTKKTGAKKTGAKKTGAKKTGAKKTGAKKTGAKKTGAKKTGAKKTGAKKTRVKNTTTKRSTKNPTKKTPKRTPTKKTQVKSSGARKVTPKKGSK